MRRGAPLIAVLLAGCAGPCASDAPIVSVDFVEPEGPSGLELDAVAGQARLVAAAQALEGFAVRRARDDEAGWQLVVRTRLASERPDAKDPSKVRRAFGAVAELRRLRPTEGGAIDRYVSEVLEARTVPRGAPIEPLLTDALEALMGRLSTSIELASASPEAIGEAVRSDDAHARAVAVRIARAKKLAEARPALEAELASERATAQDALRIAGALAELGHPESADAVIDAISRFPEHTVPFLFVLGQLGGREAAAYLFTVKSGHEEPGVRAAAEEALRDIARPETGGAQEGEE